MRKECELTAFGQNTVTIAHAMTIFKNNFFMKQPIMFENSECRLGGVHFVIVATDKLQKKKKFVCSDIRD